MFDPITREIVIKNNNKSAKNDVASINNSVLFKRKQEIVTIKVKKDHN
jgi:hypothetical protein